MARGGLRGAATAALGLIALQALVSKGGTGRVATLLDDVNGLVERMLDPSVPAIPDRSTGAVGGTGAGNSMNPNVANGGPATPGAGTSMNPNVAAGGTPRVPVPGAP